jgi:hypothetical protein
MKKTFLWCAASLIAATMASSALAGPFFGEDFFFSEDFEGSLTGWTFVNGSQTNKWVTGTPTSPAAGTNATAFAYISNGTGANPANAYTHVSSVVHLYRDLKLTGDGIDPFKLSFDWRAYGEGDYDFLRVFVVDTTTTPVAGWQLGGVLGTFNVTVGGSASVWYRGAVLLPASYAGTTKRLVFSWRNDGSAGGQPPAAIDNIAIEALPMPSYAVTTSGTSGNGSLYKAINDANAGGGGIINIDSGVGTITLSATLPAITGNVTINGNGLTISGSNACRIMSISPGAVVSISRVRFDNGTFGTAGGAIYNNGGRLALQSCIFSNNRTTSADARGGAIFSSGRLTVSGCTFYGNTTGSGGAIYNYEGGTATLTGNLFYGNTATISGNVVYQADNTSSGGYNVSDKASGEDNATSSGFNFAAGDVQSTVPVVSSTSFRVLPGSIAAGVLPADSLPAGYPTVDFYNQAIAAGGAAGAVLGVATGYMLDYAALGSGTLTSSHAPDGDGIYAPATVVTLSATPVAPAVLSYWTVNGVVQASHAASLQVTMDGNKVVRAVFERMVTVTTATGTAAGSLPYALTNAADYDIIEFADGVTSITLSASTR